MHSSQKTCPLRQHRGCWTISVQIEQRIPEQRFTNYRKRLTSGEEYHQRVEQRIDDLITRLENKEIKLADLSDEDQQVIMDILNQND